MNLDKLNKYPSAKKFLEENSEFNLDEALNLINARIQELEEKIKNIDEKIKKKGCEINADKTNHTRC